MKDISPRDLHPRRTITVLDSTMTFVDTGDTTGMPAVFLHGNPTSSYLWRNVLTEVTAHARCLAPDLMGMGESGDIPGGQYRFVDHQRYLDAWFDALDLDRVVLVVHDWGSALGFDWARRHPDRVQGIAYMEAIVRPITWDEWPSASRSLFQALRSPAGENIILEKNVFVEKILPASIQRSLSADEMARYRARFRAPGESRRPTLSWPRQIPVEGEPADVVSTVQAYADWLSQSTIPKLFINGDPGTILVGAPREFCRGWPNQQEVTVAGLHFLQEDSPQPIGQAVARFIQWLAGHG